MLFWKAVAVGAAMDGQNMGAEALMAESDVWRLLSKVYVPYDP